LLLLFELLLVDELLSEFLVCRLVPELLDRLVVELLDVERVFLSSVLSDFCVFDLPVDYVVELERVRFSGSSDLDLPPFFSDFAKSVYSYLSLKL
jgi:hypothetical protein